MMATRRLPQCSVVAAAALVLLALAGSGASAQPLVGTWTEKLALGPNGDTYGNFGGGAFATSPTTVVVYGGRGNSLSGQNGLQSWTNRMFEYDLTTNNYTLFDDGTGSNAPNPGREVFGHVLANANPSTRVFVVVGGLRLGTRYGDAYRFQVGSKTWLSDGVYPGGAREGTACAADSTTTATVYCFGGFRDSGGYANDVYSSLASQGNWALVATSGILPGRRAYASAAVTSSGYLIIAGGQQGSPSADQDVYALKLSSGVWARVAGTSAHVNAAFGFSPLLRFNAPGFAPADVEDFYGGFGLASGAGYSSGVTRYRFNATGTAPTIEMEVVTIPGGTSPPAMSYPYSAPMTIGNEPAIFLYGGFTGPVYKKTWVLEIDAGNPPVTTGSPPGATTGATTTGAGTGATTTGAGTGAAPTTGSTTGPGNITAAATTTGQLRPAAASGTATLLPGAAALTAVLVLPLLA